MSSERKSRRERERDRSGLGRRAASGARGQTGPGDIAGEAELIQPGLSVVGHARGDQFALPGRGRRFKALELLDHRSDARLAHQPRVRRQMLPAQEESQVVLDGDRLDLGSEPGDCVAMDPGEQSSVAVFFRVCLGQRRGEVSAHDFAVGLKLGQAVLAILRRQAATLRHLRSRHGSRDLEVSADELESGVLAVGGQDQR